MPTKSTDTTGGTGLLTDTLEKKYGKISLNVVLHDHNIRKVHLLDSDGISRTFAVTLFKQNNDRSIADITASVIKGNPIGKELRRLGYTTRRNVLSVYDVELPTWLMKAFHTKQHKAEVEIYEFYAKKEGEVPILYGIIAEILSPEFIAPTQSSKIDANPTTQSLLSEGFSKDEIWGLLESGSKPDKVIQPTVITKSKDEIIRIKKQIADLIRSE